MESARGSLRSDGPNAASGRKRRTREDLTFSEVVISCFTAVWSQVQHAIAGVSFGPGDVLCSTQSPPTDEGLRVCGGRTASSSRGHGDLLPNLWSLNVASNIS